MALRDEDLIARIERAQGWHRVPLVAELGGSEGTVGPAYLRSLVELTGPRTSDLRCAALYALAKRCGATAHEDYVRAFHSTDHGTRGCAMIALAEHGRDGLWDEVAARLRATMRRPDRRGSSPPDAVVMIVYLLRHSEIDPRRTRTLVELLRQHWAGLDPDRDHGHEAAQWIATYWPEAAPGGPPPEEVAGPDLHAIAGWVRSSPYFSG